MSAERVHACTASRSSPWSGRRRGCVRPSDSLRRGCAHAVRNGSAVGPAHCTPRMHALLATFLAECVRRCARHSRTCGRGHHMHMLALHDATASLINVLQLLPAWQVPDSSQRPFPSARTPHARHHTGPVGPVRFGFSKQVHGGLPGQQRVLLQEVAEMETVSGSACDLESAAEQCCRVDRMCAC